MKINKRKILCSVLPNIGFKRYIEYNNKEQEVIRRYFDNVNDSDNIYFRFFYGGGADTCLVSSIIKQEINLDNVNIVDSDNLLYSETHSISVCLKKIKSSFPNQYRKAFIDNLLEKNI